jgi:hypothetical protein
MVGLGAASQGKVVKPKPAARAPKSLATLAGRARFYDAFVNLSTHAGFQYPDEADVKNAWHPLTYTGIVIDWSVPLARTMQATAARDIRKLRMLEVSNPENSSAAETIVTAFAHTGVRGGTELRQLATRLQERLLNRVLEKGVLSTTYQPLHDLHFVATSAAQVRGVTADRDGIARALDHLVGLIEAGDNNMITTDLTYDRVDARRQVREPG